MVGKYPIGSDTITFYAPYVAKFRFDPINMFFWGHLTSWLLMKLIYTVVGDPYLMLKIVGSALYGFLLISFYAFMTSSGWSRKKSLLVSLFLLVQVPTVRLSWDLFHNVLGLSFMFLAFCELNKIRESEESEAGSHVRFALFSILTALTHQMTFFTLVVITIFLLIESRSKRPSRLRALVLVESLLPALFTFALIVIVPRLVPFPQVNPFQVFYEEPLMEQAATRFFVDYLGFIDYSELFNRIVWTFITGFIPLVPLVLVGFRRTRVPSFFGCYTALVLLCTFSPLLTGVSLFNWDRWMWLLVFPLSVYAFNGIGVVNERISRLKSRNLLRKSAKIGFSLIMALSFLFLCFVYVTRPQSDPFILYGSFPSKWYLPETMRKTAIPFEYIPDLEDCVRWLDTSIKENSALLFESQFSGPVLLNLTPRNNVTLISYYPTEFDQVLLESASRRFNSTYLIFWADHRIPTADSSIIFVKLHSKGSLSVYTKVEHLTPPSLTDSSNLLLFNNETYVEVSDSDKLSPSIFTLEFWAKPTSFTSWSRWMGKSLYTFNKKEGWQIMWTDSIDDPGIFLAMWDEYGVERASQLVRISLNEWMHVVFTFNGSHLKAFRGGNLEGVVEVGDWEPVPSREPLRIGRAFGDTYYDGFFAGLRFYNRSLSSPEVLNNLLGEVVRDGLVLEFDFINRGSLMLQDLSGEANDGNIVIGSSNQR